MVPDSKEIAVKSGQEREVESLMREPVKVPDKESLHMDVHGYFLSRWVGDEKQPDERITPDEARNWIRDSSVTAIDLKESMVLGWVSN